MRRSSSLLFIVCCLGSSWGCGFSSSGLGDGDGDDEIAGSEEDSESAEESTETGSTETGSTDSESTDSESTDSESMDSESAEESTDSESTETETESTETETETTEGSTGETPGQQDLQIETSADDAEESTEGNLILGSSDLEMVDDPGTRSLDQLVGLRFQNFEAPAGATITAAYLQFTADNDNSNPTSLEIRTEASTDAPTFTNPNPISARDLGDAVVDWSDVPPWNSIGAAESSPDVSALLQQVVDQNGWSQGSAVVFIITGSGEREAKAWDGEPNQAPRLHVEWLE